MTRILIIGATSDIAQAYARLKAPHSSMHLAARNEERLTLLENDLRARGCNSVTTSCFDALNEDTYKNLVMEANKKLGKIDIALIAHGTLVEQEKSQVDSVYQRKQIHINCISTLQILEQLASLFSIQKQGTIACITSVAGLRGRQSNYAYGACKAMISTALQGIRNRLTTSNITVLDIRPGLINTKMTKHFPKSPLWVSAQLVAGDIDKAIGKNKSALYTPYFWRYIMLIITFIPERIFKKMRL